jgi:uncharacterized protein YndB with AHSA1/START domain
MATGNSVAAPDRTLVTTRIYDAPRELVYRAWTDPKQLAKWFPPEGLSSPRCEVDARPGGVFRVDMKAPDGPPFDGKVFPGPGVFQEVVANERLVFTMTPEIEPGRSMPMVLMSVRFEDYAGKKTKLTVEQTLPTVADYEAMVKTGMEQGINESLDKLAGVLSGKSTDRGVTVSGRTLTLVRVFEAPRELVWTAYTDPKHITKWMFANDWEAPSAENDLRAGGRFTVGMRPADHSEVGFVFSGTYREVVKPERIVLAIDDGRVMTTTFEDVLGGTRLRLSLEMALDEAQERLGYTQILDHFTTYLATLSEKK